MEFYSAKRIDPVDAEGLPIVSAEKIWIVAYTMTQTEFEQICGEAIANGELNDETDETDSPIITS